MIKLTAPWLAVCYLVETMGIKWFFFITMWLERETGWLESEKVGAYEIVSYSLPQLPCIPEQASCRYCASCAPQSSQACLGWNSTICSKLNFHISPLSSQGETGVWCRERCSCEAHPGLGLNAGLGACESYVSLICTVQYTWIALKPRLHQAAGGGSH